MMDSAEKGSSLYFFQSTLAKPCSLLKKHLVQFDETEGGSFSHLNLFERNPWLYLTMYGFIEEPK